MSVKLRLRRLGRRKRPLFSIVATDSRSPRDGRYIEDLGRYAPLEEPAMVKLEEERIMYWLDNGAQPSDTVRSILSRQGTLLKLQMRRKGAGEEEIETAVSAHRARHESKLAQGVKKTASDRRREALAEEEVEAKKSAEEAAKARAEAEAKAKKEAEEARKKAQAEAEEKRKAAAAEAKAEQKAANEAQEAEDTDGADAPAEETAAQKKRKKAVAAAKAEQDAANKAQEA
ncbi:MAG: 30S ribosomal protein S16, partial [Rhodothermales bacterium]|nr:30S ribosomal protein S16 [Rhodothermales bacterium]